MPKALIIGSQGQDGTLLKMLLRSKNYEVHGVGRSASEEKNYFRFDLGSGDFQKLNEYILKLRPDEIYFVAAFHHSSEEKKDSDFEFIRQSVNVNELAFVNILELCRVHLPACRIAYTSSSLIYSGSEKEIQDEKTPLSPRCVYSYTKCAAMQAAGYYRGAHGLFVSIGIMFNHESVFRNDRFLSKKIVNETRELLGKKRTSVMIGDLSSVTDWGYAGDYAEALWHMLQLEKPDTFIVSSGKGHRVQDWFEVLGKHLNLDWKKFVQENPSLVIRKKPVLIGDNSKLINSGWKPKTDFQQMVIKMYENQV